MQDARGWREKDEEQTDPARMELHKGRWSPTQRWRWQQERWRRPDPGLGQVGEAEAGYGDDGDGQRQREGRNGEQRNRRWGRNCRKTEKERKWKDGEVGKEQRASLRRGRKMDK